MSATIPIWLILLGGTVVASLLTAIILIARRRA